MVVIPVEAGCGRCGFRCRAMSHGGVAVAYPDRASWSRLCLLRSTGSDPISCAELRRAFATLAKTSAGNALR